MAFRAIGKGDIPGPVTTCPKQAAREFFAAYPARRVCHVIAGSHAAGAFIPAKYEPGRPGQFWRDVTRRTIDAMGARGNV
jgi:hypothetical protein